MNFLRTRRSRARWSALMAFLIALALPFILLPLETAVIFAKAFLSICLFMVAIILLGALFERWINSGE